MTTSVFLIAYGDPRATTDTTQEYDALREIGRALGDRPLIKTHSGCYMTKNALNAVLVGAGGRHDPAAMSTPRVAVPTSEDRDLRDLLRLVPPETWPSIQAVVAADPRTAFRIASRALGAIRAWALHQEEPLLVTMHPIVAGLAMWEVAINLALKRPPSEPHVFEFEFTSRMRPSVLFPGEIEQVPYYPPFT